MGSVSAAFRSAPVRYMRGAFEKLGFHSDFSLDFEGQWCYSSVVLCTIQGKQCQSVGGIAPLLFYPPMLRPPKEPLAQEQIQGEVNLEFLMFLSPSHALQVSIRPLLKEESSENLLEAYLQQNLVLNYWRKPKLRNVSSYSGEKHTGLVLRRLVDNFPSP